MIVYFIRTSIIQLSISSIGVWVFGALLDGIQDLLGVFDPPSHLSFSRRQGLAQSMDAPLPLLAGVSHQLPLGVEEYLSVVEKVHLEYLV